MKVNTSKILVQFTAGIFGGTILGITGFLNMISYGGNHGCFTIINSIFDSRGYESCGSFGAIAGIMIGTIIGIIIFSKIKIVNHSRAILYLILGSFILPFLFGVSMFWPPFENSDILIVIPIILAFMLASVIPSTITTWAIYRIKKIREIKKEPNEN